MCAAKRRQNATQHKTKIFPLLNENVCFYVEEQLFVPSKIRFYHVVVL